MAAGATPTLKQLRLRTGQARLETEQLVALLVEERTRAAGRRSPDILALFEELTAKVAELRRTLDVPVGPTVEQTARRLGVSEPTVRKWLRERLLVPIDGRKPVEVEPGSVLDVAATLDRVRENHPEREWTKALAAYLHDRDLAGQPWFREGVDAHRSGETVAL